MKDRQFHIYLDDEEYGQVLQALIALKNNLIAQGRYTDAVDDVLIKFTKARKKKMTVQYICYGFIDGEEKTQRALLTKIEAYLKYTKSAEFQNEYLKCPIILRVTFKEKPDQLILDLLKNSQSWIMEYDVTLEVEINNKTIKLLP